MDTGGGKVGANEETLSLVFKTHPDACFLKAMNYIMQVRKLLMAKKRFPSHSFFQSFHFRQYKEQDIKHIYAVSKNDKKYIRLTSGVPFFYMEVSDKELLFSSLP